MYQAGPHLAITSILCALASTNAACQASTLNRTETQSSPEVWALPVLVCPYQMAGLDSHAWPRFLGNQISLQMKYQSRLCSYESTPSGGHADLKTLR